jgi:hypothetical protein
VPRIGQCSIYCCNEKELPCKTPELGVYSISCGIPAWLFNMSAVIGGLTCFSGPLIQYHHFTAPDDDKSRYCVLCAGPRWWVQMQEPGTEAQILTPGQSAPLWE